MQQIILTSARIKLNLLRRQHVHFRILLTFSLGGLQLQIFLLEEALLFAIDRHLHVSLHRVHGFLEGVVGIRNAINLGRLEHIILYLG